ncbi:MAG TPA: helix-turn-helix domain-containing protein [Acidimicrobiales bacterium]|nr:helix-turn-helix domain-containing protein [Acidimicrobiales bacterium]
MRHDLNHQSDTNQTPRRSTSVALGGSTRTALPQPRYEDRVVVTVSEAAELLGISRAFAYELVARGDLPVICLGRRRLVPKVALHALVEGDRFGDGQAPTS